jgi:hypothetical protein
MGRLFISIIFILTFFVGDNFAQRGKTHFGDKKLESIHKEFINDCKKFGLEEIVKDRKLKIIDYENLGFSYLGITFPKVGIILIDTLNMRSSKELFHIVVYHELAHFYLHATHINCEACIMRPSLDVEKAKQIYRNFELHKYLMFQIINFNLFLKKSVVDDIFEDTIKTFNPIIFSKSE